MTWVLLTLAVVAVLVVAAVVIEQQRSAALKRRFGPEYDRVVEHHGDRRGAEAALRERLKRRTALELRDLPAGAVDGYQARWPEVQSGFVDDPAGSVAAARDLIEQVVADRGYHEAAAAGDGHGDGHGDGDDPGTPDAMELVAVDHPQLVTHYRNVRAGGAAASLDDLRATFIHYRELFEAVLVSPVGAGAAR